MYIAKRSPALAWKHYHEIYPLWNLLLPTKLQKCYFWAAPSKENYLKKIHTKTYADFPQKNVISMSHTKLERDYDLFIAFIFIKNKLAHMKPSALANDMNVFLQ